MEDRRVVRTFRDLRVWQSAYDVSIMIYKMTATFPKHEQFGLSSQMQRSAVSVCSNIAEGFGRKGSKEKDQFYSMANGSLTELENQLLIAQGVGYIDKSELSDVYDTCEITHKMLVALQQANKQRGA